MEAFFTINFERYQSNNQSGNGYLIENEPNHFLLLEAVVEIIVSWILDAAADVGWLISRITSQTQQDGAKKFSLEMLCPLASSDMSFFLIYFCRQRDTNPNGSDT